MKDYKYWEQSSSSLSFSTAKRRLLHSLMGVVCKNTASHVPYHPTLREQTPSLETEEQENVEKCGEGMCLPRRTVMGFAKVGLSYPIRSCTKNQKLPNRISLQNRTTWVKLTNWRAVPSGSHFKLANKRWCCAGQGLNDISLLRQSKMNWGS